MKLLTTPHDIENTLSKLIISSESISFASAWASASAKAFKTLLKHSNKINKIVVGIHFYQTHPNFIKEFIENEKVKFITNPNGIFHPKMYLFVKNDNDWDCLIGSANFTKSAMEKNSEIMIHINSKDINSNETYKQIVDEINTYFNQATIFTQGDYEAYLKVWTKKSKKLLDIQDNFNSNNNKPIFKSKIIMQDWSEYSKRVKNDKNNSFDVRLEQLNKATEYFKSSTFANMTASKRKQLAGISNKDNNNPNIDWMYFGHMVSPRFKTRINEDYFDISESLECIPLVGKVTKKDYMCYIQYFQEHSGYGYGISTISRLLTMKRPDVFFCVTGENKNALYEDFGIEKDIKSHEYERYWDEIIQRIHKSEWFNIKEPSDVVEKNLWNKRVAMLDAIFYEGEL